MTVEVFSLEPAAITGRVSNRPVPKMAYTKKEAAGLISISTRQLDYLIDQGEIPVLRVGRRVLITHQALQSLTRRSYVRGRVQ